MENRPAKDLQLIGSFEGVATGQVAVDIPQIIASAPPEYQAILARNLIDTEEQATRRARPPVGVLALLGISRRLG